MIVITPLIKILEEMLNFFYGATGNYGFSLILLSLAVTFVMLPLFWLAEKIQAKDRAKKRQMKPEIVKLKAVANVQKKHFYIRRIYQQFGYHPIHSLSSLLGLAIQIPFFIAAYKMLGDFSGFDGVSFGFIVNLAQPDGMLSLRGLNINILPVVMTVANLIAGFLYSKNMDKAEKIQLFCIAILFFILLYNQPAALVLYWTMNNIFSIGKNWWFAKKTNQAALPAPEGNNSFNVTDFACDVLTFWQRHQNIIIYLSILSALYFLYAAAFFLTSATLPILFIYSFGLLIALCSKSYQTLKQRYKLKPRFSRIFFYILCLLMLLAIWSIAFFAPTLIMTIMNYMKKDLILTLIIAFLLFNFLVNIFASYLKIRFPLTEHITERPNSARLNIIGALALFFLIALIMFYLPMIIYASSPAEFIKTTATDIINKNVPMFVLLMVSGMIAMLLLKFKAKFFFVASIVGVMLFALANGICLARDFGKMSFFVFSNCVIEGTVLRNITEYILFICCFAIAYLVLKNRSSIILCLLLTINIIFAGMFISNIINQDAINVRQKNEETGQLELQRKQVLNLSKTGKNIIVLILDMFPGGFIEPLFNNNPTYKTAFAGFVWYPDTLSVCNLTYHSVPVMNAGWQYTPEQLNERPGTFMEKSNDSYHKLFSALQKNNYNISYVMPTFYQDTMNPFIKKYGLKGIATKDFIEPKDRVSLLKTAKIYHKLLQNISMFLVVPSWAKRYVYDDGLWKVMELERADFVARNKAFLESLSRYVTTDATGNTFKRYHNALSHDPYVLDVPVKGKEMFHDAHNRHAYSTMKVTLDKLVPWLNSLRAHKVYHNTKIIIISDHSHEKTDNPMQLKPTQGFPLSTARRNRLHALLMVKNFNSHKLFTVDHRLMSNGDVAAIVAAELTNPGDLTDAPDPTAGKLLIKRTLPAFWLKGASYGSQKLNYEKYTVSNSMFEPDNWKKFE
jgi:YidC/Oxa1 family membrane protein insertase